MYLYFFARVIVGINFKHSPNSEHKPRGAIIVAGNFRYLLLYIDHDLCRLSFKADQLDSLNKFCILSENVIFHE